MYLCLAALSIGIFASCKTKKGVEATFSDLDGSWNIVELNGKVLNPAETNPDMSGERELLQALDKVVRFDAEGEVKPVNKIALYGTDNTKLMVIEKK